MGSETISPQRTAAEHRGAYREGRDPSTALRMTDDKNPFSVRADDAADLAGSWFHGLGRLSGRGCPLHTGIQHIQIFQAGAGVEEDYRVFGLEESTGAELAVGDQAGCAFGCGEDSFHFRPVAGGFQDFFVRRADGCAFALL